MSVHDAVRAFSLELEEVGGEDSLTTVEEYYRNDANMLVCPFPACGATRRTALDMFKHVHFGQHGKSFGYDWREFVLVALGRRPASSHVGGES